VNRAGWVARMPGVSPSELSACRARAARVLVEPVDDRGAATLDVLRLGVGDPAFFAGARPWLTRYQNTRVRTPSKPTS